MGRRTRAIGITAIRRFAAISAKESEYVAVYHNTFWNNGRGSVAFTTSIPNGANSQGGSEWGGFVVREGCDKISFFNNILAKTIGDAGLSSHVRLDNATEIVEMDNNIYFQPPTSPKDYEVISAGVSGNFASYALYMDVQYGFEIDSIEQDPLIETAQETWYPWYNSPARNAGRKLATITGVGSNHLTIDSPVWYFRVGDRIKFGGLSDVEVTGIDTNTNAIQVAQGAGNSSLVGEEIVLNDWDYDGSAPDIGAIEHQE